SASQQADALSECRPFSQKVPYGWKQLVRLVDHGQPGVRKGCESALKAGQNRDGVRVRIETANPHAQGPSGETGLGASFRLILKIETARALHKLQDGYIGADHRRGNPRVCKLARSE